MPHGPARIDRHNATSFPSVKGRLDARAEGRPFVFPRELVWQSAIVCGAILLAGMVLVVEVI